MTQGFPQQAADVARQPQLKFDPDWRISGTLDFFHGDDVSQALRQYAEQTWDRYKVVFYTYDGSLQFVKADSACGALVVIPVASQLSPTDELSMDIFPYLRDVSTGGGTYQTFTSDELLEFKSRFVVNRPAVGLYNRLGKWNTTGELVALPGVWGATQQVVDPNAGGVILLADAKVSQHPGEYTLAHEMVHLLTNKAHGQDPAVVAWYNVRSVFSSPDDIPASYWDGTNGIVANPPAFAPEQLTVVAVHSQGTWYDQCALARSSQWLRPAAPGERELAGQ